MPKNNQQLIKSYQDFSDESAVTLSPQSTGVRLRLIPAGTIGAPLGTQVFLPPAVVDGGSDDPSDGDSYEVIDADGSANITAPIIVTPPTGTTIDGASGFALVSSGASATFTYDAPAENWLVSVSGLLAEQTGLETGTIDGQLTPGNITPNIAGAILAAAILEPKSTALFQVNATFGYECAAGDTVQLELRTYGDATVITGGAQVGGEEFFYETTGGGSPVVTAGSGPTLKATFDNTVVAGKQGIITVSALVQCLATPATPPALGLLPVGLDLFLSTLANGSALTVLRLDCAITEVL